MAEVAYLGLGSNVGDRRAHIASAVADLRGDPGIVGLQLSTLHETDPVGGPPGQDRYLNGAARVETTLDPGRLLSLLLAVEQRQGRVRRERWGSRSIDLDLLLFGDRIIDQPGLTVPHPRMHQRRFVLTPLAELAPEVVIPVLDKTVAEILAALP